jgi:hypothetical protein
MMCGRIFSTGVISLTAVYAGFVVALQLFTPKCLDEPCSSEGVDTTTVGWATEVFIVGAVSFFAIHLALSKLQVSRSGILAQIFMGGGLALSAIGKLLYGNNGLGDGKGMAGYWVLLWVAYTFFTLSMLSHGTLALETSDSMILLQKPCCSDRLLRLFQGLVIFAYLSVLTGCMWCATSSSLHVDEAIDDFEDADSQTCVRIVEISELVWMVCYALFWIPAAQLLRAATRRRPQFMLGLYSPDAASSIIVIQYTIGPIYVAYLRLAAFISDREPLQVYEDAYGAIISHFGVLMTFYFAYNLSMALSLQSKNSRPQSALSQEIVIWEQELDQRKKTIKFEDDVKKAEKNKTETAEKKGSHEKKGSK